MKKNLAYKQNRQWYKSFVIVMLAVILTFAGLGIAAAFLFLPKKKSKRN